MNYICFSLYGNQDKYVIGAVRNAGLARRIYPGWRCAFWVGSDVPATVIKALAESGSVVRGPDSRIAAPMFWRFLGEELPGCHRFIVRDADSRLNPREAEAVSEWVKSGKSFHSMKDHPAHAREINGGLWGCVAGAIPNMRNLIEEFDPDHSYGTDQDFLCRVVWPLVKHDCMIHDSCSRHLFPGSLPFPTRRNGSLRFVGEVFDVLPDGQELPRDFDCVQINGNED